MRHHLFLAAAALLIGMPAWAADVKIIANASLDVTEISAEDLKGVFLANKSSLSSGSHVEPVLLKAGAVHEAFLKEYIGKNDAAFAAYLRGLVFTGKALMPKTLGSDAEVVAYVSKTKGAIGYVGGGTSAGGAKTLTVK